MSAYVQLMLVVPCMAASRAALDAALDRFAIGCVLLTPPDWRPGDPAATGDGEPVHCDPEQCRALVGQAQAQDVAAIIANDAAIAAVARGDGCHLDPNDAPEEAYRAARSALGPDAIIGVMPGRSRHTAMTLAEAGADYVAYAVDGVDDADALEAVAWWAEIFSTPVVAFTDGTLATCRRTIEVGPPDFLAVPLMIDGGCSHLPALSQLIAEHGALPIAAKDAK